jgi:hypothetical protein
MKACLVASMSVSVGKPQLKQNGRFVSHVMEAVMQTVTEDIKY